MQTETLDERGGEPQQLIISTPKIASQARIEQRERPSEEVKSVVEEAKLKADEWPRTAVEL